MIKARVPNNLDTTTRMPAVPCRTCGVPNDAVSGDALPGEGDFSICGYCGEVSMLDAALCPVLPKKAELQEFMKQPGIAALVERITAAGIRPPEGART